MKRNDENITPGDIHHASDECAAQVQDFASTERDIEYKSFGERNCNIDGIHAGFPGSFPRSIHDLDTGENHMVEGGALLAYCDGQTGHQCYSDHRFFYSIDGDSIDDVMEAIGDTIASVGDNSTLAESTDDADAAQLETSCGSAIDDVPDNIGGLPCHVICSKDDTRAMDSSIAQSNLSIPGTPKTPTIYHYPEMCEILRSLNGLPYPNPGFTVNVEDSMTKDSQSSKQRDSKLGDDAIAPYIQGLSTEKQDFQRYNQCDEDAQSPPEREQNWVKKELTERTRCLYQEHGFVQRETNDRSIKKYCTSNVNRPCSTSYSQGEFETHDLNCRKNSKESSEHSQNKDITYINQHSSNACTQTKQVPGNVGFNCRLFQEEPLVDSLIQDWTSADENSSYSAAPAWYYQDTSPHVCSQLEHGRKVSEEEYRSYPTSFWYYPDVSPNSGAQIEQSLLVNEYANWNQDGCEGNVFTYPDVSYLKYVKKEKRECKRSRERQGIVEHNQQGKRGCRLWEFIRNLLLDPVSNPSLIRWEDREVGTFRLVQSKAIARIWGSKKGNEGMNYEKLSRAMRYYYKRQIFAPVYGKRLVYSFGPRATGWRATEK